MAGKQYLFVYGTLRKELNTPMSRWLARRAQFCGRATYQGKLFDAGAYPGAIPSKSRGDKVDGDLYAARDEKTLFRVLDHYEGKKFRRQRRTVRDTHGNKLSAWIYLLRRPPAGLRLIPGGNYARFKSLG
ncbi:MAG TPA: gamma-glutamylcyclotransferase family protein [Candidatus Acidoferrales bacterium]|nr:gamma-glutamylcyclotransferase family protein [Candidatus Acidoferrales bacterium]